MNIKKRFKKADKIKDKNKLSFDNLENKLSKSKDMHAFILLDKLFPNENYLISRSYREQLWFSVDFKDFKLLTDDNILELCICGIYYDAEYEALSMFV